MGECRGRGPGLAGPERADLFGPEEAPVVQGGILVVDLALAGEVKRFIPGPLEGPGLLLSPLFGPHDIDVDRVAGVEDVEVPIEGVIVGFEVPVEPPLSERVSREVPEEGPVDVVPGADHDPLGRPGRRGHGRLCLHRLDHIRVVQEGSPGEDAEPAARGENWEVGHLAPVGHGGALVEKCLVRGHLEPVEKSWDLIDVLR